MANTFRVDSYRSAKVFAYIAVALLSAIVLFNFLYIVFGFGYLVEPTWQMDFDDGESFPVFQMLIGIVGILEILISLVTVVFFLIWLHRSFANLSPLKARNLEFSPGWAVGWWFVPFANLVKPYQAVTELWRESDPDFDEDLGFLSSSVGNPAYFGLWWACWIISNVLGRITFRLGESTDPEMAKLFSISLIVASLFTISAGVLIIYIIWETTNRQEKRFQRIGYSQVDLPPQPPVFNQ